MSRFVALPYQCLGQDEPYLKAFATVSTPCIIHSNFQKYIDDVRVNGKPDLVIVDYDWQRLFPYMRLDEKFMHDIRDVPHIFVFAGASSDLPEMRRHLNDPDLNIIHAMEPADIHGGARNDPEGRKFGLILRSFEQLLASQPAGTKITAELFKPLLDRINPIQRSDRKLAMG